MIVERGSLRIATTEDGTDEVFIRRVDAAGRTAAEVELSPTELRWLALTGAGEAWRHFAGRARAGRANRRSP